ncbi:hypothetical protein AB0L70_08735 [Kribbella sp. NPDC051952]|uniref:hypothetical protein n=1 Tax=Kribbella sp. NPDC051952 TaxID=3154851 RepID=UPI00341F55D3
MSLWEYVDDAETAEGGLTGARWEAAGAVLGRLHRRLAEHPTASPSPNLLLRGDQIAAVASTYPLTEPLDDPSAVDESLQIYARARHEAALILLDHLS